MSVWPETMHHSGLLFGNEGELISVRVTVPSRMLEDLLEALAHVPFPVNPQILHGSPESGAAATVEFPAYRGRLDDVRKTVGAYGFDPASLQVRSILDATRH